MTTTEQVKKLKKKIDVLRPLTKSELAELHKWYAVTYTYHSNALEGNTLTLGETKLVVEDGITVGGHPLREILVEMVEMVSILIFFLASTRNKKRELTPCLHDFLFLE